MSLSDLKKLFLNFLRGTMYNEVLMAYSRGAIANVCMLSKFDWRIALSHTYTVALTTQCRRN